MCRAIVAVLAATTLLFAAAPVAAQEVVESRFRVDRDAYVRVFLQHGSVRVTGWGKDSIAVTGTVDTEGFFAGGKDRSAKLGVWAERSGEGGGSGRLEVRVPASATLWIKTESAEVRVATVTGAVDVYSVTGTVRIAGEPRQVYAESMGGRIEIAADTPSVRAKSAGGDVAFRGRSQDLALSSVTGSVAVETVRPLRARLETVSGSIRWDGGVDRGGALDIVSHDGAVDLSLPSAVDAEVAVTTIRGTISMAGSGSTIRARQFERVLGAGGARVTVRTFSGDVTLRPR